MADVILQAEKIEIVEKIVDPQTGEVSDQTKFSIIPQAIEPPKEEFTISDLKLQLQEAIEAKAENEQSFQQRMEYWDKTIALIQEQIQSVIDKANA